MTPTTALGVLLSELARDAGLSATALARTVGLHPSVLRGILRGRRKPSADALSKLWPWVVEHGWGDETPAELLELARTPATGPPPEPDRSTGGHARMAAIGPSERHQLAADAGTRRRAGKDRGAWLPLGDVG